MSTPDRTPQRVCFTIRVRPELLDEYLARHSPVWPEMLAEIAASGRRNYSLFHLGDGHLVGVYETDDDEASRTYLAASEVATRWEESMRPFFLDVDTRADQAAPTHPEVFHLESQLAQTRS